MRPETYNSLTDNLRLTAELLEADRDLQSGAPTVPAQDVFAGLRAMIDAQTKD